MEAARNNPYDLMGNDPDFSGSRRICGQKALYPERGGNGRQILARVDDAPHGRVLEN